VVIVLGKSKKLKMLRIGFYYSLVMIIAFNIILFWSYGQAEFLSDNISKIFYYILIMILDLIFLSGFVFMFRKIKELKG